MREICLNKVFVYGTLLDEDILNIVLSNSHKPRYLGEFSLKDYQAVYAKNQVYPILIKKPGHNTFGQVIEVTNLDLLRLDFYEGEGYNRVEMEVFSAGKIQKAFLYMPNEALDYSLTKWSINDFIIYHKVNFILKTKTNMLSYKGE